MAAARSAHRADRMLGDVEDRAGEPIDAGHQLTMPADEILK
jgi:hypothetical protein